MLSIKDIIVILYLQHVMVNQKWSVAYVVCELTRHVDAGVHDVLLRAVVGLVLVGVHHAHLATDKQYGYQTTTLYMYKST